MTLYLVQAASRAPDDLVKAHFIKEGFSWPAFVFAQLWLLWNRLWLVFAAWVGIEILYFVFVAPHVAPAVTFVVDLLARLLLAVEASHLRARRNVGLSDLVEARDRDEAETLFFRRHAPDTPEGAA